MVRGRLDVKASTATAYAWFVWEKAPAPPRLIWIACMGSAIHDRMGTPADLDIWRVLEDRGNLGTVGVTV